MDAAFFQAYLSMLTSTLVYMSCELVGTAVIEGINMYLHVSTMNVYAAYCNANVTLTHMCASFPEGMLYELYNELKIKHHKEGDMTSHHTRRLRWLGKGAVFMSVTCK